MYPTQPHQLLTDDHYTHLVDHGYLILPNYIRSEELTKLQSAQRRCLKPWDQVKADPPQDRATLLPYPPPDVDMAALYPHPELLNLARRYLKTPDLHFNVGYMLARYPGYTTTDIGHIDNANNSLLPMSESLREFSQLVVWIHLEEVGPDQAPLLLCSNKQERNLANATPLACPAGTITLFTNYTWHAASSYQRSDGQRFTWGFMIGRADHPFEGLLHYTSLGQTSKIFNQVIARATAEERSLFRFPKPNHPYYTKQTLAALESQYPGFNARNEYQPTD